MNGNGFNKDGALLIVTAMICSAAAWAFFHYGGEHAMSILLAITIVGLITDNRRLRKEVQSLRQQSSKPTV